MKRTLLFIFLAVFITGRAWSQEQDSLKNLSLEDLMNIEVVSVSKRVEKLAQTASAIQVITRDDIRQSGVTSVPEALRLAPNLQVAQVNSSQWAISARGFNNVLANKLLVLIDGRVVYTPMYAGVFWDVQNLVLEDIERIEVISGPGGTLWGANAVNGVINIITRNAADTKGLYAEAAVGTYNRVMSSVRYGGALSDNLTYRVYGTAFKRDNTIFADSIESADDWQMALGGARMDWKAGESDNVMLVGNYYNGRPDPDGGNPVVASGSNILSRWNHRFSERADLQVQAYYDQTWRDFRNDFTEDLKTYDIEAQHRLALGQRHEFIYGAGIRYMNHTVENLELFAFRPARKDLYLYNIFVQEELFLVPEKLRVTVGLKAEHNTYTKFQYQPNARVNWTVTERNTLWAAASRAVRNPARIDREFYLDLVPGFPFIAGSNFRSEEVIAYEAGWRTQPVDQVSVSLATFYNVYDNIRTAEPGPPPFGLPITFGNGVKGETYGIEMSATWAAASWWKLRGGYTFLKKNLWLKPGSNDSNNASAESNDPQHQALVQSEISLPSWEIGTMLRYVSELSDPKVDAYAEMDVRLAWRPVAAAELSIVGQNLLQKSHVEFIPSSPDAKGIERSVYIKVSVRF